MMKLVELPELLKELSSFRTRNQTVSLCHGVFDLVHPGHLRHLKYAKSLGDILVVSITADRYVNKGPGRPAFNQKLRAEFLSAIDCVDYVLINEDSDAVKLIETLCPNFYVKGSDYVRREDDPTGRIHDEEQAVISCGGSMAFSDEIVFSSSNLINTYFDSFPPEVESWLRDFRAKTSLNEVVAWLDRAVAQNASVIGEAIIDEYVFCNALGKSSKDPLLAFQHRSLESYLGGTLAIANHLAGLGCNVKLLCEIGDLDNGGEFIRRNLLPRVQAHLTIRKNAHTIHKRRFVDTHTGSRVFELYTMDDCQDEAQSKKQKVFNLEDVLCGTDLTIVADYGHGMIGTSLVDAVIEKSPYLVLNSQSNAGNRGFNLISKYCKADYVCLAAHEAQLEARSMHMSWMEMAETVLKRVNANKITITRGRAGTFHLDNAGVSYEAPALASNITDRVGAGDAVLAITGILHSVGAPVDIVAFYGNIAGAHMVGDLGNRSTLTYPSIIKAVNALMK